MLGILAGLALAGSPAQTAREAVRLDLPNATAATSLAADAAGGLAAAAWVDTSLSADAVWLSASADLGRTWSVPRRLDLDLSGASKELRASSVDVVAGEIRVCWLDARSGANNLFFRASRDAGASWGPELRVDDGHAAGQAAVSRFAARASATGGALAIALLLESLPGGDEVRVARSANAGVSFAASGALHAGGTARALDLEMDGPLVHLAWSDDTLVAGLQTARYLRSLDGGATWPGPAVAVSGSVNVLDGVLDLAADGARVAVVFQDLFAIHAVGSNHSTDGGGSWLAAPLRVAGSRSPSVTPAGPQIFFTPAEVLVTWSDDRATPGALTPWLAGSSDAGAHWLETALAASGGTAPRIAGDSADGSFAVQWETGTSLLASGSRAALPEPLPPFEVAAAGALPLRAAVHAYDPAYAHHFAAWLAEDAQGVAHVWAGGFRVPGVSATGALAAGTPLVFRADRFRAADAGREFRVLLAQAPGAAPLPFGDGRSTGLAPGAWLTISAGSSALRGTLDAAGHGLTGSALIPGALPAGTRIDYAAVVFDPIARSFGDLADARYFLVL